MKSLIIIGIIGLWENFSFQMLLVKLCSCLGVLKYFFKLIKMLYEIFDLRIFICGCDLDNEKNM